MTGISALCAATPWAVLPALWPLFLPLVVALSRAAGLADRKGDQRIATSGTPGESCLSIPGLIRIGITGSYGKTSVKHILGAILSEKVSDAHHSRQAFCNTPMGVTRAIREKPSPSRRGLRGGDGGAAHVGDIKEMCRLVHPTIGIITSVGPQRLETFKSIERVASTKYELMDALPADGFPQPTSTTTAAWCAARCTSARRSPKPFAGGTRCKLQTAGATGLSRVPGRASPFRLHVRGMGSVECHTRLLGAHSIQNILLAAAVASGLGLDVCSRVRPPSR